jgi:hypothetical protein
VTSGIGGETRNEQQLGVIAVTLALRYPDWVLRRVEQVSYIDDTTVRWRVSVTVRWPAADIFPEEVRPREGQKIYVPLALLKKEPLIQFDLRDEGGASLTVLPTEENARLAAVGAAAMIWSLALAERTRTEPGDDAIATVQAIVTSGSRQAQVILDRALDGELGRILSVMDEYRALLTELASSFMLLVPVEYHAGRERVLKFAYSSVLPWSRSARNVASRLGWIDNEVVLTSLPLGSAGSYHIDIAAPDDVHLAHAVLTGEYLVDEHGRDPAIAPGGTGADGSPAFAQVSIDLDEDGDSPHVNLHSSRPARMFLAAAVKASVQGGATGRPIEQPPASAAGTPGRPTRPQRSDKGFATIRFRPETSGVFAALTLISIVNVVLLFWAKSRLSDLDGQVAAAVLLAVPVLIVGYLARPGEHRFATRLLSGVRLAALLPTACTLSVAMLVAGGLVEGEVRAGASYRCAAATRLHGAPGQQAREVERLRCTALPATVPANPAQLKPHIKRQVTIATWIASIVSAAVAFGWLRTRTARVGSRGG